MASPLMLQSTNRTRRTPQERAHAYNNFLLRGLFRAVLILAGVPDPDNTMRQAEFELLLDKGES